MQRMELGQQGRNVRRGLPMAKLKVGMSCEIAFHVVKSTPSGNRLEFVRRPMITVNMPSGAGLAELTLQ
jgi:hypothetical protein